MPSGFINDANQLQAEMYRVVITMSNTTYYPTADGNTNGGVTPYGWDYFPAGSLPTSLTTSKARSRGNMRFRNVANRLTGLTDCQIHDVTITEANADAQATSLAFTVKYERPSFIALTGAAIGASTVGNDVAGNAMDTTAKRIANEIALGLRDATTAQTRVYDPTLLEGTTQSLTVGLSGGTAAQILGTVSVTLIDESTLFD
jgi:hypothetical protein